MALRFVLLRPFTTDLRRRPYNTLALPCECVIA